jgi:hypothetical protein
MILSFLKPLKLGNEGNIWRNITMEWFTLLCNGVVFFAAVVVAIKNIAEILGKPIVKRGDAAFRRKTMLVTEEQEFKDRIIEIMNEVLPGILYQHDLKTRDTYRADR